MIHFDELFSTFNQIKVGVIGDVMLDTYWWGHVERISPEAPVPVVSVSHKEKRIGGAGNVALNLSALDAVVHTISVLGNDDEANELTSLMQQHQINTDYIIRSNTRITTNKIRIISRNQHMMRLDAEMTRDINAEEEDKIIASFKAYVLKEKPQIVILEDYNKGVLTEKVIHSVIEICKNSGILTAVDPKRKNFFCYQQVDIFKPNLKEAKEALNIIAEGVNAELLNDIHLALHQQLQHNASFITLSEKGVYFQTQSSHAWIHTHVRNIADVSGAGDTVIAVASLAYAATRDFKVMAEMANIAGGLVCEEVGTVAINKERLLEECKRLM